MHWFYIKQLQGLLDYILDIAIRLSRSYKESRKIRMPYMQNIRL